MTATAGSTQRPLTVVNVICTSYSGSTWFNLMLGTHSRVFSVGEMKQVYRHGQAHCTLHGETCPFWSRFEWPSGVNPFEQLCELSGQRIFVVNNSRKLLDAQRQIGAEVRFVRLIRDGRAVAASMMRKNPKTTMWKAARRWAQTARRDHRLIKSQPPEHCRTVYYEQALAEPVAVLRSLCDWLNIDYEPTMRDFSRKEHHYLGGNRGTLTSIMAASGEGDLPASPKASDARKGKWDLDYYRKVDPKNFRDERWRKQLTPGQLRVFDVASRLLNRRLGYR